MRCRRCLKVWSVTGFVLGLLVDLAGKYEVTSDRESGFGRYDVMLQPHNPSEDDGIILELKYITLKRNLHLKRQCRQSLNR